MIDKIYRLADERDVGKEVFFAHTFKWFKNYCASHLSEKGILNQVNHIDWVVDGRSQYIAFVEVTPADFSDEQLIKEFNKRALIENKDLNNFVKQIYEEGFKKGSYMTHDKEKTLADFTNEEITNEFYVRQKQNPNYWYDKVAEAYKKGKRDAVPKWISVEERLPELEGEYLCMWGQSISYKHWIFYYNGKNMPDPRITHWMPFASPSDEEQPEPARSVAM